MNMKDYSTLHLNTKLYLFCLSICQLLVNLIQISQLSEGLLHVS